MPQKKILYLSGPMSGIPDDNFPAFDDAAETLRAAGYRVVNPADFGAIRSSWNDTVARDLLILASVDGIAMLEGWGNSKGASLERHVAVQFGKPAHSVEFWKNLRHPVGFE